MRIGVVNDLPMAAEVLRRIIVSAPEHELAWIARDGREAVDACARDLPDLVLMDLIMPVMDGVEATRLIMAGTPCPILVVVARVDDNVSGVYEAMGHGALDAVDLPAVGPRGELEVAAAALLARIAIIGRLSRIRHEPGLAACGPPAAAGPAPLLIAIGASAGGPAAVARVLEALPARLPAALVLVQHIDEAFVPGFAEWLGQHTRLAIAPAVSGARPQPGRMLIAATADHLELRPDGTLGYTPEPRATPYRPSVDVFFASVARHWPGEVAGVLLTGMGRDGAQGLKLLCDSGHLTIAQDKQSCSVYGMPKAAAELGAAREILSLERIPVRLAEFAESSHARIRAR